MIFYMNHTLTNPEKTGSFFKLPTKEELPKGLQNPKLEINKYNNGNEQKCVIYLSAKDAKKYNHDVTVELYSIPFNCSAIQVCNLYSSSQNRGMGTWLMQQIINWAKYAGYSIIYGNTAGYSQNSLIEPFWVRKLGFQKMGLEYYNPRSENKNIWIYKMLINEETQNTKEPPEETFEEDNNYTEDYYEDKEND